VAVEGFRGGMRAALDSASRCSLAVATNDTAVVVQGASAAAVSGVATFPMASILARSGMVLRGSASCALGAQPWPGETDFVLTLTPCLPGTAARGYSCDRCGAGTYSDGGPGADTCRTCPRDGVVCSGGLLSLLQGFFRADRGETVDATTELHPCAFPNGCWVNSSASSRAAPDTHGCNPGYKGPLCGVCEEGGQGGGGGGYAKMGNGCSPCVDRGLNAALLVLLFLVLAGVGTYVSFLRHAPPKGKRKGHGNANPAKEDNVSSTPRGDPSAVILRMGLSYLQSLGVLGSLFIAKGTAAFRDAFGLAAAVGDSPFALAPVQCLLRPSAYVKFGITVALPFLVALYGLTLSVGATAVRVLRRRKRKGQPVAADPDGDHDVASSDALTPTVAAAARSGGVSAAIAADIRLYFARGEYLPPLLFVLNLGYASVTASCFSMLSCTPKAIAGRHYLRLDLAVDCDSSFHSGFSVLVAFVIAMYGLGFPLLFAFLLHRNRARLSEADVFDRWGFLLAGYRLPSPTGPGAAEAVVVVAARDKVAARGRGTEIPEQARITSVAVPTYAWESIVLLRKAAVVMIGALLTRDGYMQATAAVFLLTAALVAQSTVRPFARTLFNVLETVGLCGLIATVLISVFYLRAQELTDDCTNLAADTLVEPLGVTCAELLARRQATEDGVTSALALLNLAVVGSFVVAFFGFTAAEAAVKNPTGRLGRFVRTRAGWVVRWFPLVGDGSETGQAEAKGGAGASSASSAGDVGGSPQPVVNAPKQEAFDEDAWGSENETDDSDEGERHGSALSASRAAFEPTGTIGRSTRMVTNPLASSSTSSSLSSSSAWRTGGTAPSFRVRSVVGPARHAQVSLSDHPHRLHRFLTREDAALLLQRVVRGWRVRRVVREWERVVDGDGDTFFRNRNSGELAWVMPEMPRPRVLAPGWARREDAESGEVWYVCEETGESCWTGEWV
jgi:hypothetical protein